jgi:arginine decarboxylase
VKNKSNCYGISRWGSGYFGIDSNGFVEIYPHRKKNCYVVSLREVMAEMRDKGIDFPVLLRIQDILIDRVQSLLEAFHQAIEKHHYQARYTPVYPIKVNQQNSVIDAIVSAGKKSVGLEAGSKTELIAILGGYSDSISVIVCNGYKDEGYIRLALMARRLGYRIFIVIEKLSEWGLIEKISTEMKIEPLLGVRIKLTRPTEANWQNSGGNKAKFGLSASDLLQLVSNMKAVGQIHLLQLLHFHLGSQIANIDDLRQALLEACHYFVQLGKLDCAIKVMDVGGGLAVDYDGQHNQSAFSKNYSMAKYADLVVATLYQLASQYNLPQPEIFTESGRAMTAHHAMLITNVIDVERQYEETKLDRDLSEKNYRQSLTELAQTYQDFCAGELSLIDKANTERRNITFQNSLLRDEKLCSKLGGEMVNEIASQVADKVFCNFSLFQSLPDAWGLGQVFPVMPLQRLNEQPSRRARIQDLTCDSDGHVEKYPGEWGTSTTLSIHEIAPNEEYCLGFFMLGAYQEILGDMHNLFGDPNTVDLKVDGDGQYQLHNYEPGDSATKLLEYVHFNAAKLQQLFEAKVKSSSLKADEVDEFIKIFKAGLGGCTYLSPSPNPSSIVNTQPISKSIR